MNDFEFKLLALSIIGIMMVIAIYPVAVEIRGVVEPFSELGVLGPNMKLGDYPSEVAVDQRFTLYVYVGNHEGVAEYYRVLAKLVADQNSVASNGLYEGLQLSYLDFILSNESNSTKKIELSIPTPGVNQRVIFELYRYEPSTDSFVYHQRWTQLWMNVTAPA